MVKENPQLEILSFPEPITEKKPFNFSVFGTKISDNYAWLKAKNWQEVLEDPKLLPENIKEHLLDENKFTEKSFSRIKPFASLLQSEMRARIKEDDTSVPENDGPYAYLTRFTEGAQHGQFCRQNRQTGQEQVLIDADIEAKDLSYFDLGDTEVSPDHSLLAWSADTNGSEFYTIAIRDIPTSQDQEERIEKTSGDIVWINNSKGFYYIELDSKHRPVRVKRHILGTPITSDPVIYEEKDSGFFISIEKTQSGRFIIIGSHDHETSEAWLLDADDANSAPVIVTKRNRGVQYEVEHWGNDLIILTNADGAEDFKIISTPVTSPDKSNWQDLVPHRPGVMLLSVLPLAQYLIRAERENANTQIIIRDMQTSQEQQIVFEDEAYALSIEAGREFDTSIIRFVYSSMRVPSEVYDYNIDTQERILRKRQEVPSGHNPEDYIVARIMAVASDGAEMPVSLIHHKDTPIDGSAPCLLYGYGSYGHSISAGFRTNLFSLVDRGFIYAIAHIRGGTEKGWHWYQNGKRDKKMNTFTDFITCAEQLIRSGYTSKGAILAQGGSAGGMLMGAVANLAPELFAGIIAEVPFVDVLNTMLDTELPLTPPEWPEWGNPAASKEEFETILAYSPYDNIKAQNYPAILALGGLTDPRVTYWEPAKWVAKLRATMTGGGPIFLQTNMDAGHGGASGRFDRLEEVALVYSFAIAVAQKAKHP
ncbi:S9 family peptidase [Microvirga sp. W0021]|uniref:S9 family peptidase n=1 Tax=Hohaiivirga grylli TaxID=3133970 RepID=A0ABV0BHG4_9HYPH